jgi:DHA3 family macrolide efflux protein-like MFS transporter
MEKNWKKNAALFITGQAISLFGSMLVQYAILWHITLKTQSGTMMTLFTVVGFLPMFFVSPFGGVWADRFNRKLIINIADGAIALTSLIVALLMMMGHTHFGILLICAAIRSFGQGVQTPAVGAVIPQIVPNEHLTRINGIQGSIQSMCMLAAPVLSAALMTLAPLQIMFFVDVGTAAIGISILIFFVEVPSLQKTNGAQKSLEYFSDIRAGLSYIRKHGFVFRMIILSAVFSILVVPIALLTPLQTTRNFGADVWRLSAIEISFSIGMTAGGLLIAAWGGFKNRVFTMTLACLLFGLEAAWLGLTGNFWLYIGIMAAAGLTMPLFNTPAMVMMQSAVEPEFMGRVLSVFTMVGSVMMPLGMLIFGPIADRINIDIMLIGTGIAIALLVIPFMTSKVLREAGQAHLKEGEKHEDSNS